MSAEEKPLYCSHQLWSVFFQSWWDKVLTIHFLSRSILSYLFVMHWGTVYRHGGMDLFLPEPNLDCDVKTGRRCSASLCNIIPRWCLHITRTLRTFATKPHPSLSDSVSACLAWKWWWWVNWHAAHCHTWSIYVAHWSIVSKSNQIRPPLILSPCFGTQCKLSNNSHHKSNNFLFYN